MHAKYLNFSRQTQRDVRLIHLRIPSGAIICDKRKFPCGVSFIIAVTLHIFFNLEFIQNVLRLFSYLFHKNVLPYLWRIFIRNSHFMTESCIEI